MSRQVDEPNWETGEVILHVENTESLYWETEGVRSPKNMKRIVKQYFPNILRQYEWHKVDWDAVVETRNEG